MTIWNLLIFVAAASSLVLLLQRRAYALVALVASGLEALLAFGIIAISIKAVPLTLILGAILAVVGGIAYVRTADKTAVTAATLLAVVGAIQVLSAVGFL